MVLRTLTVLLLVAMVFDFRYGQGEAGMVSVSIFELLAGVGMALLLLAAMARRKHGETLRAPIGAMVMPSGLVGYLAVAGASAVAAVAIAHSTDGLHALKDMSAGTALALIVMLRGGTKSAQTDLYWTVGILSAASGALALMQLTFGWPYLHELNEHAHFKHAIGGIELVRQPAVGTVTHPNAFAVLLGPLFVLTAGYAASGAGGSRTKLLWFLVVLAGAGLVASQAKMAVLIFLLGALASIWLVQRRVVYSSHTGRMALFAGVGGFLALLVGIIAFGRQLSPTLSPDTLLERIFLNATAFDVLGQSPWNLIFGGCVSEFLRHTPAGLGVHNEYISQVLKFGIPTTLLFCSCMYAALNLPSRTGWRIAPAIIATSVVFLVEGAAGTQHQAMVLLLWACAASARHAELNPEGQ